MPRALNASTAMIALSFAVLTDLDVHALDNYLPITLVRCLAGTITASTAGQDVDLTNTASNDVTIDSAVEIARGKSGRLIAGACELGTRLADLVDETMDHYRQFGMHLGTAYQLNNDLRDAFSVAKSDLTQIKNTVPLVYYLKSESANRARITRESLKESGALQFTSVLIETERLACSRIITALEGLGHNVTPLRELLVVK